jgi:hypothetical protein
MSREKILRTEGLKRMEVDYMGFWIAVRGLRLVEGAGKPVVGRFIWAIRRHGRKKIVARGVSDHEISAHTDAFRAVHELLERGE